MRRQMDDRWICLLKFFNWWSLFWWIVWVERGIFITILFRFLRKRRWPYIVYCTGIQSTASFSCFSERARWADWLIPFYYDLESIKSPSSRTDFHRRSDMIRFWKIRFKIFKKLMATEHSNIFGYPFDVEIETLIPTDELIEVILFAPLRTLFKGDVRCL